MNEVIGSVYTKQPVVDRLRVGFFYSALLIMLGYNLFLTIALREKSYLYYVLFLASFTFSMATYEGLAQQYLWPNATGWSKPVILLSLGLFLISLLKFTSTFLQTRVHTPKWHRLITTLVVLTTLAVLFNLLTTTGNTPWKLTC